MHRFASAAVSLAAFVAAISVGCASSDDGPDGANPAAAGNGPSGPGGSSGSSGTPSTPACTDAPLAAVSAPKDGALLDLAVDASGPWLLVLDATNRSLSVVRADGETKVLEAKDVTTGALSARSDGKVCAAWGVSKPTYGVRYACGPDFAVVDTKVELQISQDAPLAFYDTPTRGALLFKGKFASLDGIVRDGDAFRDADVSESSISYPGSTRALSGAEDGAPYCWIAKQGAGPGVVVVESWLRGGSANTWGTLGIPENKAPESCAVALSGSTLGVLATGGGRATFKTASTAGEYASPLVEEPFDATDIGPASLHADKDGFVVVYGTKSGAVRATRKSAGGAWESKPLGLPPGKSADRVAMARENGREHIAVSAGGQTFYERTCPR